MYIQQIYSSYPGEAAYYIESNGEAAVVDPLKDIGGHIQVANDRNAVIKYIFETHYHADLVINHMDLCKKTGASIIFGPETKSNLPVHIAKDGEIFKLGEITLQVLHTPGYSIESSCYLLKDENDKNHALFSGDTLFTGDSGRPGLGSGDKNKGELAGILYDTLQQKILPLPDDILVYPALSERSSRDKNKGRNNFSTIGEEKQKNRALQPQSKAAFIKAVTEDLVEAPGHFSINGQINKEGYISPDIIKSKALTPLSIKAFKNKIEATVTVLDTRHGDIFPQGFLPGSIFIGLEGRFAEWAGSILSFTRPILLITEPGREEETVIRLTRVGFCGIEGYLEGGFDAWIKAGEKTDMIIEVEADELAMDIPHDPNLQVVDVRRETEFADGHIKTAINIPLNEMTDLALVAGFEENQNLYVHSRSGYRSLIACSLMKIHGLHNLRNISGGWEKIKEEHSIKIAREPSALN
ncbi:MAG: rhodanese-like domain-containing protein [Ferruginibacter sp.]